jgi:DNA-binding CsgD family transcriptional regulator
MGMPNFGSTLVLALVFIAAVIVVLFWFRRSRRLRHRVDLMISRAVESNSPALNPDRGRRWLYDTLTQREMQVARLVAQGRHNKEIARELNIAPHTVESHIRSIYEKLSIHTRVDLAREIRDLVD